VTLVEQKANPVLKNVNYYHLVAYGLTLKDPANENQYIEETTFKQLVSIMYSCNENHLGEDDCISNFQALLAPVDALRNTNQPKT